jgi:hypothetical protein
VKAVIRVGAVGEVVKGHILTESKRSLESEIAKVQVELIAFRDEYLPLLLDIPFLEAMPQGTPAFVRVQPITTSNRLSSWQQALVRGKAAVSEEQRRKWLESGIFRHIINNALLHLFGALANNHFMLIRDYLDHPCLYGGYTGLMPHYLFAVLFQKVCVLCQLATEDGGR